MKFGGKLGDRPPIHWKFSTVTVTGGGWPIELLAGPKYAGGADPQNEHFHRRSLETNMVSSLVPKMVMKNCSIWLVAFPVNPWYRSENGAWGPKKYGHKMMECIRFWDKPERHWCLVCWWNIYIYIYIFYLEPFRLGCICFWEFLLRVCRRLQSSHGLVLVSPAHLCRLS